LHENIKETPMGAASQHRRFSIFVLAAVTGLSFLGAGCRKSATDKPQVIRLDYAYYSPLSLVLKQQHIVEDDLAKDAIKVEWTQSLGSNKALELLNSKSVDFGSTAGAAALIGRANGNPIKTIYVSSRPEWTALVVLKNSPVQKVQDLKGKKIAVTRGTDPFVFLLRALYGAGLTEKDVELVPLQHADGRNALERGDVDAWAGLDPMMAQTELDKGSRLVFRDVNLNSYSVLNVRDEFAQQHPDYVKRVLADYEKARSWAIQHPEELRKLYAEQTKLNEAVATRVLERNDFSNSVIGDDQKKAIAASGDVLKKAGVISATTDINATLNQLIDPQYVLAVAGSTAQTASAR
jgi:sulfonate transport system substrate-binding protein